MESGSATVWVARDPKETAGAWKSFILAGDTCKEDRLTVVVYLLFNTANAVSTKPATDLSEAWDGVVPTSKVHWWVKEARRLGLGDQAHRLQLSDGTPIDLDAGPVSRGGGDG